MGDHADPQVVILTDLHIGIKAADSPHAFGPQQREGGGTDKVGAQNGTERIFAWNSQVLVTNAILRNLPGVASHQRHVPGHAGHLLFDFLRKPFVVIVQKGDIAAFRRGQTGVSRGAGTLILLMNQIQDLRVQHVQHLPDAFRQFPVVRTVVDHDQFHGGPGLPQDTFHCPTENLHRAPIGADHRADKFHLLFLLFRLGTILAFGNRNL